MNKKNTNFRIKILLALLVVAVSALVVVIAVNPDFIKGAIIQKKIDTNKIINVIPQECLTTVIIPVNLGGTDGAFNTFYDAVKNGKCSNYTYEVSLILPSDTMHPYTLVCSKYEMGISWYLQPDKRVLLCTKTLGNVTYQATLYNEGDIPRGVNAVFTIFYSDPTYQYYSPNNTNNNKYYVRTSGNFGGYKIEKVDNDKSYSVPL
jgi:hypothetical protein